MGRVEQKPAVELFCEGGGARPERFAEARRQAAAADDQAAGACKLLHSLEYGVAFRLGQDGSGHDEAEQLTSRLV